MWDFLGGLGGLFDFGGVLDAIGSILAWLANLIITALNWLLQVIVAIGNFFLSIFRAVGHFFTLLYDKLLKGVLTRIVNGIIRVHQWLEEKLAPVLRFLQRVRAYLDRIFKLYIRPILNLIDRIRKILLVLRLLHVKWAAALDQKLAQIEGTISKIFLEIRGILNNIIDVVNSLTDPPRMARIIAGTIAGRRAAAVIIRMTTGLPAGHFLPTTQPGAPVWERPVLTSRDITDPLRNPPASVILGSFLPLAIGNFTSTAPVPTDGELDDVEPFGYGADVLESFLQAEAAVDELNPGLGTLYDALTYDTGVVADMGHLFKAIAQNLQ
jgi:hypothetical protein